MTTGRIIPSDFYLPFGERLIHCACLLTNVEHQSLSHSFYELYDSLTLGKAGALLSENVATVQNNRRNKTTAGHAAAETAPKNPIAATVN